MRISRLVPIVALSMSACDQPTDLGGDRPPDYSIVGVVQSASGSWVEGGTRTFAFDAERLADGTVRGRWERVVQSGDRRENGSIVCFAVEGRQVWVGTRTEDGPSAGTDGWFRAVDNGEGEGAPPDLMSLQAVGAAPGVASAYCNARPNAPSLRTVGSGQVQIRARTLPEPPGKGSTLLATIEWPFSVLERESLPAAARIQMYFNGFYNAAPCTNAETQLSDVVVPWNTSPIVHRYDVTTDPSFGGYAACLTDGTDEVLSMGIDDVSGWAIEESIALQGGAPDLVGHTLDYIQLVVDQLETQPSSGGTIVTAVMRWEFFGS